MPLIGTKEYNNMCLKSGRQRGQFSESQNCKKKASTSRKHEQNARAVHN